MNDTVEIFDEETGEAKTWKRYSARIPDFNEKYGPGTGYRVESSICALSELQPLRMKAITEAVANGFKPDEFGLGKLSGMMVMSHRLIDSDGNVVCDSHAAGHVGQFKDLECLETASHQRLMARLGFGGEIFDNDEDHDFETVEVEVRPTRTEAEPAAEATAESPPQAKAAPETPAEPAQAAKPARSRKKAPKAGATPEVAPVADPKVTPTAQPGNGTTKSGTPRAAPPAMIRQLTQLAERVGEEPPEVTTFAEAKAQLKRLSGIANGASAP